MFSSDTPPPRIHERGPFTQPRWGRRRPPRPPFETARCMCDSDRVERLSERVEPTRFAREKRLLGQALVRHPVINSRPAPVACSIRKTRHIASTRSARSSLRRRSLFRASTKHPRLGQYATGESGSDWRFPPDGDSTCLVEKSANTADDPHSSNYVSYVAIGNGFVVDRPQAR